ncbi:MAG: lipoyl(octanoyl) transferase LipB [Acetobacterales bacterium]
MVDTAGTLDLRPVEWRSNPGLVGYEEAVAAMEARVAAIREGSMGELAWALEHPPLYTAGTSASDDELLDTRGLPVYRSGRGGRFTWHGPGQRVVYLMLDLKLRGADVRSYVCDLESWIIAALARLGVTAERRAGRIGIWVVRDDGREEKIAALGVRVRRWVTYHGIAINVAPDLAHFGGIVPCGIAEHGVTSLKAMGVDAGMDDLDAALKAEFEGIFRRALKY